MRRVGVTIDVLAGVRALIARAVRGSFEEEAKTAALVAARLIHEHDLLDHGTPTPVIIREVVHVPPRPVTPEEIGAILVADRVARARRGGEARAAKLTPERRKEIARAAARARRGRAPGP